MTASRATRLVFLVAGLGVSLWAPLVPYAQARLAVGEGTLGLLLLCLGVGSILAMPVTGALANRFGCRAVILWSGAILVVVLPGLALASTIPTLAATLFLFGGAVGTLDVAVNIQAVMVEREDGRPLMSGFHGFFSLGGILGAGGAALALGAGAAPLALCLGGAGLLAVLLVAGLSGLLARGGPESGGSSFALPRGPVVVIGLLCFVCFLAEGAMLDWSALLLTSARGLDPALGGWGYAAFALAMTAGRLTGDRIVAALGGRRVLLYGGLCAAAGFGLCVPPLGVGAALVGFALVGLGASNIVPVLFTAAGRAGGVAAGQAIAAVTTLGYAGILAGPAGLGGVIAATDLPTAFLLLALAMLAPALAAGRVTAPAGPAARPGR
jgi:predicted MFS family arabinose efflux permease